ncbi:MAG TPA: class I SAM-dependent methyltransferase [Bryobacteraceae bacterium]|jgi:SAM-dependent methyltransferase
MMNRAEFANIARCERDFWWYRGMEQILYQVLDPIAGRRPLHTAMEAGCGTGRMAAQLQRQYGWRIFPTDLERDGLLYGLKNGFPQSMAQADMSALPFASQWFDVVVSLDVIAHFPRGEEQKPVRELVRVLAPGGLMVLRVAALDVLRSRHSQFTRERQRFTRKRLLELVSHAGIRVLRCSYANSLLLPVALTKFRVAEPLLRMKPASGIRPLAGWLDALLYRALLLEAAWLKSGRDLPVGQSLILVGERTA